jgi:hypothetical protein
VTAAEIGNPATYLGQPIDATTILMRYTRTGDANVDGTTNVLDFALLAANFNNAGTRWGRGDFNYDGTTNIGDFSLLAANFNLAVPADSSRPAAAAAAPKAKAAFSEQKIESQSLWNELAGEPV